LTPSAQGEPHAWTARELAFGFGTARRKQRVAPILTKPEHFRRKDERRFASALWARATATRTWSPLAQGLNVRPGGGCAPPAEGYRERRRIRARGPTPSLRSAGLWQISSERGLEGRGAGPIGLLTAAGGPIDTPSRRTHSLGGAARRPGPVPGDMGIPATNGAGATDSESDRVVEGSVTVCVGCGKRLASVLEQLGSLRCHDCRDIDGNGSLGGAASGR
jgi:hypothetical protein